MNKPEPNDQGRYNWLDISKYIEHKLDISVHDVAGTHRHFDKWCDQMGHGDLDPEGKRRGHSQIWFAEFKKHPEGMAMVPPYQNFWHFIASQEDIHNGIKTTFNFDDWLSAFGKDAAFDAKYGFVRQIIEFLKSEFGNEIKVRVAW